METRHANSLNGNSLNGTLYSDPIHHESLHNHALIPRGVADYFWDAANYRRGLENRLLAIFGRWGYGYILPPTLEYADTFEGRFGNVQKRQDIVRFLDHDGQSLALRYDMTIAIARLVGTRLHDAPMPQRFCYVGTIFRHADPQAGQQREFGQAGVELIGADSVAADTEVIVLTVRALQTAGLQDFRISLGQLQFFRGLLEELALSPAEERLLSQAVSRRSEPEIQRFLAERDVTPQARKAVETILKLSGTNCLETLEKAKAICLNESMSEAVNHLYEIYQALVTYDMDRYIHLDLSEVNDLGYYTGIRFLAYAPGLGFSIASGGRYNNLIGTFGPPQPAVGVALGIERILLALQSIETANLPALDYHVLVSNRFNAEWVAAVEAWRVAGINVIVDVNDRRGSTLSDAARQKGIAYALDWTESGFDIYDCSVSTEHPNDHVSAEESTNYLLEKLG